MQSSERPPKRRQSSYGGLGEMDVPDRLDPVRKVKYAHGSENGILEDEEFQGSSVLASSSVKMYDKAVAPFLTRHIPSQYAPLGSGQITDEKPVVDPNSKYCYRHRPDLRCRRQADEPLMDRLQRDLDTLSQDDRQAVAHVWSLFSAAPSKHRNLMLQGILAQCCFPQLSLISASVQDLLKIDFVAALPAELSYKILCYLDTTSLCKAAQVSRRWRELADNDVVWQRMCEQHIDRKCTRCGWGLPSMEQKRLRATKRMTQLRAANRSVSDVPPNVILQSETCNDFTQASSDAPLSYAINPTSQTAAQEVNHSPRPGATNGDGHGDYFPHSRPWKDVYKDRFKIGSNWKHGRCSVKIFRAHTNGVTCLQFLANILATASYDTTIKIWDMDSGEELRTLSGHTQGIRCLHFDDTKLISGSLDGTLKVWNWRSGQCISTYAAHDCGVIGLDFEGDLVASASADKTVKLWNFRDRSKVSLRGHTDWVNAVKLDMASRTIFSASDDLTIRLWDLDTNKCICALRGHVGQVQQIVLLPRDLELDDSGTPTGSEKSGCQEMCSVNGSHNQVTDDEPTIQDVDSRYAALFNAETTDRPPPPRYILSSALDSTIRLWEVSTGQCLKTFFGHVEGVWALAADALRVVSGGEDRMVKVWDSRTGNCEKTYTGHAGPVTCIGLSDSSMCTGSEDGEVRRYCFRSGSQF